VSEAERREHERIPASSVAIRVKFNDVAHLEQYYLRDISRGGIFLRAKNLRELHEQLYVVLALPDGSEIKLRGEVVHVVLPAEASPQRPSGMGVQFLDLTPEVKQQLEDYVIRLKQRKPDSGPAPLPAAPQPIPAARPSPPPPAYEPEDERALLRRLCWLLAEGSVMGRESAEIFGLDAKASPEERRAVYERVRHALAVDKPPRHLGAEETRAVTRLLALLETMTREDA
jgi:Tfp pilus assembly protein PilZ